MICENCANKHDGSYGSGRFCKKECAKSFSTKSNRKEINQKVSITMGGTGERKVIIKKEKVEKTKYYCLSCKKEIRYKGKYCNPQCKAKHKQQKAEELFEITKIVPKNLLRRFKTYLLKKYGDKCSICGTTEWNGKPLVKILDHIDGDHDNESIENFRLICSNCDSQLDTYKAKNKNGVVGRSKYYKYKTG